MFSFSARRALLLFCCAVTLHTVVACGKNDSPSGDGGNGNEGGAAARYSTGDYPKGEKAPERLRVNFQSMSDKRAGGGTDFVFLPESTDVLMTLREGKLALLGLKNGKATVKKTWSFKEQMLARDACGVTNIALDPQFESNHFIYVSYCKDELNNRLMRYDWTAKEGPHNPQLILEISLEENIESWHRFGSMGFDEQGVMWVFTGDHFHRELAQDVSRPMGSIQRIIPSRDPDAGGLTYPEDNLLGAGGAENAARDIDPGIYAYGFRSPWRGTLDSRGFFWVGDVALGGDEEVNLVTQRGQNFGWDRLEGPCSSNCEGLSDPIAYYNRSNEHPYVVEEPEAVHAEKRAIWVGQIYENPSQDRYEGLMDQVVAYGDLFTGIVRGLAVDDSGKVIFHEAMGVATNVAQWRVGPDGYIYMLDISGGMYVVLLDYEQ